MLIFLFHTKWNIFDIFNPKIVTSNFSPFTLQKERESGEVFLFDQSKVISYMERESKSERKELSYAKLVSRESFSHSIFIPDKFENFIPEGNNLLLKFVPSDEGLRISILPCESKEVKKILIRLEQFSTEIITEIQKIINKYDINKVVVNTSGICFKAEKCFYEIYIDYHKFEDLQINLDQFKEELMNSPSIHNVNIIGIAFSE